MFRKIRVYIQLMVEESRPSAVKRIVANNICQHGQKNVKFKACRTTRRKSNQFGDNGTYECKNMGAWEQMCWEIFQNNITIYLHNWQNIIAHLHNKILAPGCPFDVLYRTRTQNVSGARLKLATFKIARSVL